MSNQVEFSLFYIILIKQMSQLSKEIQKMMAVCSTSLEPAKKVKDVVTNLCKKMKQCSQKNMKDDTDGLINIFICSNESAKQSGYCNEYFIISCLLYIFIKYRFIRLNFIVNAKPPPKTKREDFNVKINLTLKFDMKLTSQFYSRMNELVNDRYQQIREGSLHFEEILIKCQGQNIDRSPLNKKIEIIRRRENTYQFIYQFYENLISIFVNKKMFLVKSTIEFFCLEDNLQEIPDSPMYEFARDLFVKKIIKLQDQIYINTLKIKLSKEALLQDLYEQEICEEGGLSSLSESKLDHDYNLGYFSSFQGYPFEFLSKLYIKFIQPSTLKSIKKILPRTPNLSELKLVKQGEQIIFQEINEVFQTIIKCNTLLEFIQFNKINVTNISKELLQLIYSECPYLTELQINLNFKYLIEETYAFSNPQEREAKQNERQCQLILKALRLRRITLSQNLEMAKLLIKKEYNFNSIIEIIDCIQPFCL